MLLLATGTYTPITAPLTPDAHMPLRRGIGPELYILHSLLSPILCVASSPRSFHTLHGAEPKSRFGILYLV